MLNKLIQKKSLTILGLNSGTSADSLDMAVVRIKRDGKKHKVKFICGHEKKIPKTIKNKIEKLMYQDKVSLDELMDFNNQLGDLFGRWSFNYIKQLGKKNIKIDMIASHGQTIRHLPRPKKTSSKTNSASLQIASPEFISTRTGKIVVSDFRQADIAYGGEGAPITVMAVNALLGSNSSKLIVNIGGISNYYYFPGRNIRAKLDGADCGPGNSLSDMLCQKMFNKKYDRNGYLARKGEISQKLLSILLKNRFYRSDIQSTGKEVFGRIMADKIISHKKTLKLNKEDILATVIELTAHSIYMKILPIINKDQKIKHLYLTGGGRKNIFLKDRLSEYLPQLEITVVDDLNIDGDFLEAAAYAIMGEAAIRGQSMSMLQGKVNEKPVLGRISQSPARK
jgi:anhydro-N-acetylmuramic acid kinase